MPVSVGWKTTSTWHVWQSPILATPLMRVSVPKQFIGRWAVEGTGAGRAVR